MDRPIVASRVWGPGRPGQRKPLAPSGSAASATDARRLGLLGAVLAVLVTGQVAGGTRGPGPASPGPTTADPALVTSASPEAARPFHGLLETARDGTPLLEVDASSEYRALLWNLRRLTVAEVCSSAVVASAADLARDPVGYRGKLVRLEGVLAAPFAPRRLPANDARTGIAWRAFLVDTGSSDDVSAVAVDALEAPRGDLGREDPIVVEGVFLETVSYTARGGRPRVVPLVLAKHVGALAAPASPPAEPSSLAPLALAAAVFVAIRVARRVVRPRG